MAVRDLGNKVFEWIFRGAEVREARAALRAGDQRRAVATRQARLLLEVARRIAEPTAALPPGAQPAVLLGLYRDAIYWGLAARRPPASELPSDLRALWDASNPQTVAPHTPSPASPPDNDASAALRKTLFDDFDPRSLAVTDDDASRARSFAEALVSELDAPRSHLVWLLTARWLRVAAIVAVVLLLGVGARALAVGPNLAQGKPFRLSAYWPGWEGCVAKNGCNGLMFHTAEDNEPWIEIDLGAAKPVRRVDVLNRDNCCADRAVPLIVELSGDRKSWIQVARRDAPFGSWTAKFSPKTARYVRLKVLKRSTLHLQSIAVR